MPRKYKRKPGVVPRHISWTEESLEKAFQEMTKNEKGVNEIARTYGIPSRTLRRRFEKNNKEQLTLGKHPVLGFENEKRLVTHILKLGEAGFPPDRTAIRKLAYQFAKKLGLKHNFDDEIEMAGHSWFQSFIERNPTITIRQAEGLSIARAKGLSREEVTNFYALLTTVLTENGLLDKPDRIFNMDESGVQLNNKPGKVVAKKGARVVKSVTSAEKGETITVVACCNAIGYFLPPVLILKGVNKKPEFEEGLPPGSKVYMQKKSAYINTDLFYKWLTEHFIAHKPHGKVLLILDGHASHSSAISMLEVARDNGVILLCLPSHTTSALQPLDRAVFGPFKKFYNAETNHFMRTNPNKKLNRYNSGKLIANAWVRAATPANAMSGFRGSGIYPLNSNALPDSEFAISDIALGEREQESASTEPEQGPGLDQREQISIFSETRQGITRGEREQEPALDEREPEPVLCESARSPELDEREKQLTFSEPRQNSTLVEGDREPTLSNRDEGVEFEERNQLILYECEDQHNTPPRRSPSLLDLSQECLAQLDINIENYIFDGTDLSFPSFRSVHETSQADIPKRKNVDMASIETPSKFLLQSSPIPKIPLTMSKRAKQSAEVLNSSEKIDKKKTAVNNNKKAKKTKESNRKETEKKKDIKKKTESIPSGSKIINKENKKEKVKAKKQTQIYSSSSSENEDLDPIFINLNEGRRLRKRPLIYSTDSENEHYHHVHGNITSDKGKATKGILIKKSKKVNKAQIPENTLHNIDPNSTRYYTRTRENDSVDNYCVECYENYNLTKSKSDWIACATCRQWLHETCTQFQIYCSRCGKLKAITSQTELKL